IFVRLSCCLVITNYGFEFTKDTYLTNKLYTWRKTTSEKDCSSKTVTCSFMHLIFSRFSNL
ncbi:MAG: hypothetical protein KKF21_14880, partial [Bacteroidetes bacterium]|nr:hypothetical protein [Bacteroidota bacterium]